MRYHTKMLMNVCSTELTTAQLSWLSLVWSGSMTRGRRDPQIHALGRWGVAGGGGRKKGRKMGLDKESSGNELRGKFNLLNVVV